VLTASILNNVVTYEDDTADSIAHYVDGENLAMLGEKHEILTALEAFYKISQ
jgi:uridine phosphorylase